MPSISETIRQFQAFLPIVRDAKPAPTRLVNLPAFETNPGGLSGRFYVPDGIAPVALVVVLHGCTQTAIDYEHGSGWSDLAEQYGFAVLFPEQQRANNPNLCFTWFQVEDTTRDRGEVLSIRQMIAALLAQHPIDPGRVFVTGLSAGGAMANAMLASYPEVFAGGGIIAGLPYGGATSISQALERMRGVAFASDTDLAVLVRRASGHVGPWPRITVWHGEEDRTVNVANAEAILGQWRGVHGIAGAPASADIVDGQRHRVWTDHDGRVVVEDYRIAGMGHGVPLMTSGADGYGVAGPYMIEAGISSTWRQAQSWGLLGQRGATSQSVKAKTAYAAKAALHPQPSAAPPSRAGPVLPNAAEIIEQALRSAGLMR